MSGKGKTEDVAGKSVVANGGTERCRATVSRSLNDHRIRLGNKVHANNAQILDHRGGSNHSTNRVVDNDAIAGVVIGRYRIIDLIRDIQGHLRLAVVIGCGISDGVCYFITELKVGVLDGYTR